MLEQLLKEIHNWFRVRNDVDGKYPGTYTIEGGNIALPFLQTGQYYRIIGSVFNDGLHKYGEDDLQDEAFTGSVWALGIPKAVVELATEVEAWSQKYGDAVYNPYTSESFGGYSYTKASGGSADGVGVSGWKDAFRARLNPWRKISED